MKNRSLWIAAVAMLGASSVAMANFRQGDKEFTLNGTGGNDREFRAGSVNLGASLGYFLTDEFELSVRQTASYADAGQDSRQVWNGSTRVAADWNFDLGRWRPFLGGNFGYVYGQSTSDTWEAAPEGGVKFFLNDSTFLYGQVEYQFFFKDSGNADDAFHDGQFVYSVGLGIRF